MSFRYSIVKLVLKLKGIKKSWSEDPIYIKKRKENIHVANKVSGSIVQLIEHENKFRKIINIINSSKSYG
ncbi:hypothetical protein [uncultured Aquimarina sp.]|uniref:hypothetical protein n=1 Tax=uncultured Aquimarina sp. TaxID=575652 RepID=UPI002619BF34|nr:hypothetical protein [uncultured Aquimarina sp.]